MRIRAMILLPPALALAAAAPPPGRPAGPADASATAADDFDFSYTYPPEAARIAPLRAWLDKDRATRRAVMARDAGAARREAARSGYPYRRYDFQLAWKTVTETPQFLSLSGESYAFTGGAHGNSASLALLWDKTARRRLAPVQLFASPAALQAALGPAFCVALDAERAKRRGAPVPRNSDDMFAQCPKVSETTLLLGSGDRRRLNRVTLVADPYVAGPYAEGRYEINLPVTAAVIAAVKPAYRAAFAVR